MFDLILQISAERLLLSCRLVSVFFALRVVEEGVLPFRARAAFCSACWTCALCLASSRICSNRSSELCVCGVGVEHIELDEAEVWLNDDAAAEWSKGDVGGVVVAKDENEDILSVIVCVCGWMDELG